MKGKNIVISKIIIKITITLIIYKANCFNYKTLRVT